MNVYVSNRGCRTSSPAGATVDSRTGALRRCVLRAAVGQRPHRTLQQCGERERPLPARNAPASRWLSLIFACIPEVTRSPELCSAVTLSDEVYQALVKDILSGAFAPGARLDEPS